MNQARTGPEAYRDRDLHELHAFDRAMSEVGPQLARAREQAAAGILAGMAAARAGEPLPSQAHTEGTWWGTGVVAGYGAVKKGLPLPAPAPSRTGPGRQGEEPAKKKAGHAMSEERVQVGTVEILRPRVYPIDPQARDDGLRTEVLVQPGEYPVFCRGGMTWYWQMTGTINGRNERLGDGMFIMRGGDLATPDEVTFYSPRFGTDEWADMLSEAEDPGSALKFRIGAQAQS